jgi:hypothetical protein
VAGSLGPDRDLSEQVPICHVFYLQRASQMFHGFRLAPSLIGWHFSPKVKTNNLEDGLM